MLTQVVDWAHRQKNFQLESRTLYNVLLCHSMPHLETEMDMQAELKRVQSLLLDRISSAVSDRDFAAVAALSSLAKECEAIEAECASLSRRIESAKSALNGSSSLSTTSRRPTHSDKPPTASRKAAGAEARNEWVAGLRAQGISLSGHRKRYQSAQGKSVAVAFANELPDLENRWFLGLTDEPTEVAVLLCKSHAGTLHDIVLPVSRLREVWGVLSRHRSQVKLNVKRDTSRFLLLVPGNEPLDVTRHIGNYEPLR
jgi:hypothetical protein